MGKLNLPTGLGGATHFAAMEFAQRTGINWVYIGTRGGSDSSRSVMGGETEILLLGMLQTLPHVKNGRLKLIAVSSEKRLASLPDTPTISEAPGLAGFVSGSWQGMLAPARTPPEIIEKVNDLFQGELTDQDKLVYVNNVIKGKLLECQELVVQASNNTKAQFANSPTLSKEIMNAVMDALSGFGIEHLDMPATPQRVWRAIRDARNGAMQRPEG